MTKKPPPPKKKKKIRSLGVRFFKQVKFGFNLFFNRILIPTFIELAESFFVIQWNEQEISFFTELISEINKKFP